MFGVSTIKLKSKRIGLTFRKNRGKKKDKKKLYTPLHINDI